MKKLWLVTLLLIPCEAWAQSKQVTWTQSNVASATQAQSFEYRLYVTPAGATTPNAPVLLASTLCGGTAPTVNCSTVLPVAANAALITGAKSELTAKEASSSESAKSAPFFLGASAPTTLVIIP